MDISNKELIRTISRINGFEDCHSNYRFVLEFIKDKSDFVVNRFNNFGHTAKLTRLNYDRFPTNADSDFMEEFLNQYCYTCSKDQGSIVVFRVNFGEENRNNFLGDIGHEGEIEFSGIYSGPQMIYKPDLGKYPIITTIEKFLEGYHFLKEEYFSLDQKRRSNDFAFI